MVAESVTSRRKMSRDHFWRSISRDTNVEVSALSPATADSRPFATPFFPISDAVINLALILVFSLHQIPCTVDEDCYSLLREITLGG